MYFESFNPGPHRRTFIPSAVVHVLAVVLLIVVWKAAPVVERQVRLSVAIVVPRPEAPPSTAARMELRAELPARRIEFVAPRSVIEPTTPVVLPTAPVAPTPRPDVAAVMIPTLPPPPMVSAPVVKAAAAPRTGLFTTAEPQHDPVAAPAANVATAGFGAAQAARSTTSNPSLVASAGFSAPQTATPASGAQHAATSAGFGAPQAAHATAPGSPTPTASAGFGAAEGTRAVASGTARTTSAGFAATTTSQAPPPAAPAVVKPGAFSPASAQTAAVRPKNDQAPPADVEILFKPKPVYTEEARRLKIEGEVLLDVIFLATGEVNVLRVSKGLGHGLDEAAVQAAARIRFKPAERDGCKVDSPATARITFSLAY